MSGKQSSPFSTSLRAYVSRTLLTILSKCPKLPPSGIRRRYVPRVYVSRRVHCFSRFSGVMSGFIMMVCNRTRWFRLMRVRLVGKCHNSLFTSKLLNHNPCDLISIGKTRKLFRPRKSSRHFPTSGFWFLERIITVLFTVYRFIHSLHSFIQYSRVLLCRFIILVHCFWMFLYSKDNTNTITEMLCYFFVPCVIRSFVRPGKGGTGVETFFPVRYSSAVRAASSLLGLPRCRSAPLRSVPGIIRTLAFFHVRSHRSATFFLGVGWVLRYFCCEQPCLDKEIGFLSFEFL